MNRENGYPKASMLLKTIGPAFAIIISVLALFGFDQYIDYKIGRAFQNPQNIQTIASKIRPSLIFDSKGSILADMGGESIIKDISFEYDKEHISHPTRIIITPNKHLQQAPLLTPLDDNEYKIAVSRGHMRDWQYDLQPMVMIERGEIPMFRLEIIGE